VILGKNMCIASVGRRNNVILFICLSIYINLVVRSLLDCFSKINIISNLKRRSKKFRHGTIKIF